MTVYQHLNRDDRSQIYALKKTGLSQRMIASQLGVSPSTICRELKRNKGNCGYRFEQANQLAIARRQQASTTPTRMTPVLISDIESYLYMQWSPEQISGRLKIEGTLISYERIYQHVWSDKRAGGQLYQHLRHSGKKYNKRSSGKAGRGYIPNRVDITARPSIVETKSRIGDWEGDLIIGAQHEGAILSYVDRKSKLTILGKLEDKTAAGVVLKTIEKFKKISRFVRTITFDNGKEFSFHELISKSLNASCYFATPYRSWERGLNEHTNGLVRQYFPKLMSFKNISEKELKIVEDRLNNRPRKVLGYKTPKEVFLQVMKIKERVALQG